MSRENFERVYGELSEGVSVDLNDPEVRATIRDISRPVQREPRPIPNWHYAVWIVGSALAIFVSFFLGSIAYR